MSRSTSRSQSVQVLILVHKEKVEVDAVKIVVSLERTPEGKGQLGQERVSEYTAVRIPSASEPIPFGIGDAEVLLISKRLKVRCHFTNELIELSDIGRGGASQASV